MGATPVRLVRLHEEPFSDRLVSKFERPLQVGAAVARGAAHMIEAQPVIQEIRINDLGVTRETLLPLDGGLTVITGETGAARPC